MKYINKAVTNAEQASKATVTGSWILLKYIGLAIAWAVIEIAETLRDKTMDNAKIIATDKFPAGATVFEEENNEPDND